MSFRVKCTFQSTACPDKDDSRCVSFEIGVCNHRLAGEDFLIKDICPYLCETCDVADKCPGASECLNGGTFDIETCSCKCPSFFEGENCGVECRYLTGNREFTLHVH